MKKIALLFPGIGLLILIAGCSSNAGQPATNNTSVPAQVSTQAAAPGSTTGVNTAPALATDATTATTQTAPAAPVFTQSASPAPTTAPASASTPAQIACASTAKTRPTKVGGFTTGMYSSPLTAARTPTQGVKTGTRIFSLADYANAKANPIKNYSNPVEKTSLKEDIYYEATTPGGKNYAGTFTGKIQICDQNNMTSAGNDLNKDLYPIKEGESIGFMDFLQEVDQLGNGLPAEPGDYRIDGYLYVDGKWTLTDRIDKVTFTR